MGGSAVRKVLSLHPGVEPLEGDRGVFCLELPGVLPALSRFAHRDILLIPERYFLSIPLLNLLQFALDWAAAFALSLGKTPRLFARGNLRCT
jgi:hypothetical protein